MNTLLLASALALPPLMPPSEIEPGQTGECLTVFEGTEIEPFPFIVKDVMPNFLGPGKDLVLVRLEGEKTELTGVVAGMSGSPCSIGGRLVGALAYAFAAFAKEPIAGITPMKDMLEVMKLPKEQRPWRANADEAEWDALKKGIAYAPKARADGLVPIATPLTMGGVVQQVRDHFSPWLKSRGFVPIAGGSGGKRKGMPTELAPGSAVAAMIVQGDVDIAATGTVTSVEGKEVLAFGHPFLGVGAVSVPMATARIHNTMASQLRSFKMSGSGPVVGEFTEDRLTAIGGFLGRSAKLVPVTGNVKTPKGNSPFNLEIARDAMLTPRFLAMGMANALYGRVDIGERGTVRLDAQVTAKGLARPIEVRNVYSSQRDGNLFVYAAIDVARTFATLWDTPFGAPPVIEVRIDAEQEPEPFEEMIESINLDRAVAHPGDAVQVAVRLRKNDGPTRIERFHIQVPRSWLGGNVEFMASGVTGAETLSGMARGSPRPTDLQQIADWLQTRRTDGFVYLLAARQGDGVRANVDSMQFLPGSVVATVSGSPTKVRRSVGIAWEEKRETRGVVFGAASASLKVIRK